MKMSAKTLERNKISFKDRVLKYLLKNPTNSTREMAKDLNSYPQKVWRIRKKLEEENIIWGYTAVVDENRLDHVIYLMLLKTKPMSKELAELIIKRITGGVPAKENVRLIDNLHVNGEYDWFIRFSAPDHMTARRYYDTIRVQYEDYLIEKPVMIDVNFILVAEGKINPEIGGLCDFAPCFKRGGVND
jgi:DNA-binding Lrp family transcriptional regulator